MTHFFSSHGNGKDGHGEARMGSYVVDVPKSHPGRSVEIVIRENLTYHYEVNRIIKEVLKEKCPECSLVGLCFGPAEVGEGDGSLRVQAFLPDSSRARERKC